MTSFGWSLQRPLLEKEGVQAVLRGRDSGNALDVKSMSCFQDLGTSSRTAPGVLEFPLRAFWGVSRLLHPEILGCTEGGSHEWRFNPRILKGQCGETIADGSNGNLLRSI